MQKVLNEEGITTENGEALTVILAAANIKPRRANFNVKHGVSGYKPLPMVKEEDENKEQNDKSHRTQGENAKISAKKNKNKYNKPIPAESKKDGKKIAVYTDPALFRTANIQTINAAVFRVKPKQFSDLKSFHNFHSFDWLMYIQHYIFGDSAGTLNRLKSLNRSVRPVTK